MKIHFAGSPKRAAQSALEELIARYGQSSISVADYIVAIGGDGTTLKTLQAALDDSRTPVYSMRLPESLGALGNSFNVVHLEKRLQVARRVTIRPLTAETTTIDGKTASCFAINEVVVSRAHLQAAKLEVSISGLWTRRRLTGDGVMVATPLGTGGYNRAAGGPFLPWEARLLAVTGIAIRTPSHWHNTVVDDQRIVTVDVIEPRYRLVRMETNAQELAQVSRVRISCGDSAPLTLLFDPE